MEISKVYEDENIVVINKPYGLIVHRKNATDTQPAVTDWVADNYPALENIGEPFSASGTPLPRYGIAHRLDKDTSGLLVIAKNQSAFDYLKKQFQGRTIHKHYLALVYGRPKEGSSTIDAPMGRIGMKRTTELNGKKELVDPKPAVTDYETVKSFGKFTLLNIMPRTGRTHQIRVHLKHIGCPIAGDPVYAPKGWQKPAGLKRLFLHAYRLELTTPDDKSLALECDLPSELAEVLAGLDK
ncbi:MAG TPA: RluA family pseudouridine synthase [Candidatus Paceibacterota bacterium]|nr:RluA family pseudouridine synthase [Candidatus Paceibacterota bacterium]